MDHERADDGETRTDGGTSGEQATATAHGDTGTTADDTEPADDDTQTAVGDTEVAPDDVCTAVLFDMDGVIVDSERYWHTEQPERIFPATLAGEFTIPPVSAEAMYDPTIWAQKQGQRISIGGPWSQYLD